MKIKLIHVEHFKRFAELTIQDMPPAKLVVLAGPNGTGKSSLFDALHTWVGGHAGYGVNWDPTYHQRTVDTRSWNNSIHVEFDRPMPDDQAMRRKLLYVRSAYRNDPDFLLSQLSQVRPATEERRFTKMIENDITVTVNYQRMASQALTDVFETEDGSTTIAEFREKVIGEIRDAIGRLFPDLILNSLGNPLQNGTFRFDKGGTKGFAYKNLSGGEKAAFDLLLDFVVKRREYDDTVFCIDEPEAHMNTRLQGQLLQELYGLIPDHSQLWIATHSIGMMRTARELAGKEVGAVVFLDFGERDFDKPVTLTPVKPTRAFWENVLNVALDDLASLVAPQQVVICEGNPAGPTAGKNAEHDAHCYNTIFAEEFPDTKFLSGGSSNQVQSDRLGFVAALPKIARGITVRRLIDRDDHAPDDIAAHKAQGIRVLRYRNIESYLYADEVLTALCDQQAQAADVPGVLSDKQSAIEASKNRGNLPDDVKSAAGEIYVAVTKRLGLTGMGNDQQSFARNTLAPLIRPGMRVYNELKEDIFGP